tara:strand:+ start:142 stop:423 length:282 start_codon:yes stop_codon:yes gene_type:complete
MKTFKEFQKESYSRIDEGVGATAWNLLDKASRWTGSGFGYDVMKPRHKEGNPYVKKTVQSLVTFPKTTMKAAKFLAWDLPKTALTVAGALRGK